MRRLILAILVLGSLAFVIPSAQAKYPRRGRGIPGLVTQVSDRYFLMKLNDDDIAKVFISPNTNFELHGKKSDSSHVTKGSQVRVTGMSTDGIVIESYKVNVIQEGEAPAPTAAAVEQIRKVVSRYEREVQRVDACQL